LGIETVSSKRLDIGSKSETFEQRCVDWGLRMIGSKQVKSFGYLFEVKDIKTTGGQETRGRSNCARRKLEIKYPV